MPKELGCHIDNTNGWAEAYKDVIHEASIKPGAPLNSAGDSIGLSQKLSESFRDSAR